MSKFSRLFILILLLSAGAVSAQNTQSKVAVVFNTDTTFSLMGSLSVKSFKVNLNPIIFKDLQTLVDKQLFSVKQEAMPKELVTAQGEKYSGLPAMRDMSYWMKSLRKKNNYDYVLFFFKPVRINEPYNYMTSFSYGMSVSTYKAFSAYDIVVFDLKSQTPVASFTCKDPVDFIAGDVEKPAVAKKLIDYTTQDIELPLSIIKVLNQDVSVKAYQCLQHAKKSTK